MVKELLKRLTYIRLRGKIVKVNIEKTKNRFIHIGLYKKYIKQKQNKNKTKQNKQTKKKTLKKMIKTCTFLRSVHQ